MNDQVVERRFEPPESPESWDSSGYIKSFADIEDFSDDESPLSRHNNMYDNNGTPKDEWAHLAWMETVPEEWKRDWYLGDRYWAWASEVDDDEEYVRWYQTEGWVGYPSATWQVMPPRTVRLYMPRATRPRESYSTILQGNWDLQEVHTSKDDTAIAVMGQPDTPRHREEMAVPVPRIFSAARQLEETMPPAPNPTFAQEIQGLRSTSELNKIIHWELEMQKVNESAGNTSTATTSLSDSDKELVSGINETQVRSPGSPLERCMSCAEELAESELRIKSLYRQIKGLLGDDFERSWNDSVA